MVLMQIKLSEWIIELGLYIAYLLVVIAPPFLYIWTPIETSKYLHKQYSRNWSKGYITNITLASSSSSCESGFELQTLGYWSGVKENSCLCQNLQNAKIQYSTEDFDYCNTRGASLLFNCFKIPSAPAVQLTKYKQSEFCIKRDTHLMDDLNEYLKNGQETIPKSEYETYFNGLLNKALTINKDAIVDIVISKSSLTGYVKPPLKLSDNYLMYIKHYGNDSLSEAPNIYFYNDLITDIHLHNELSCSYIEMSDFNPLKPEETTGYINFGGNNHCENFNDIQLNRTKYDLIHNDGNQRSVIINKDYLTDKTLSLNDIYLGTPVRDYYSSNGLSYNRHLTHSNYLPVLSYQRYFYGIGCPMMKSINWHLLQYDNMILCKNLVISIAFFNIGAFVLGIVFLIIKLFNNLKGFPCTYCLLAFLFMFFICISLILTITYLSLIGVSISYFKSFMLNCQIDFRGTKEEGVLKTSRMEHQFITDMQLAMSIAIALLVIIIITIIIHTGYYFIVCSDHSLFIQLSNNNNNQLEVEKAKQ